jgi:predicted nucleic acid-binding protein
MASVVIDTDVISYQVKGDSRARLYDKHLSGKLWVISFMTLAELQWWTLSRRWGRRRRDELAAHLRQCQVYFADEDLCAWWAEAVRRASRSGRPIEPSDAWIAATALVLDIPLVTHNADDYAGVTGLRVLTEA